MSREEVIIRANIARAMLRMEGMKAENLQRQHRGESPAYVEEHFLKVIDEEGISHNYVLDTLNNGR